MQKFDLEEIPHLDTEVICTDSGVTEDSVLHPALITLMLLAALVVR